MMVLLSSCTEIIQLDLNSANKQIVVESGIGTDELAKVKLSETINIDSSNEFPKVQNATITITNDNGEQDTFEELEPGIYQSKVMKGEVGKTYNLKVVVGATIIESTCKIPPRVAFDSLKIEPAILPGGGPFGNTPNKLFQINLFYKDSANYANYYRVVLYKNGVLSKNNYVYNDKFNDGNPVETTVFISGAFPGDKMTVEFQCIDKAVYEYFNSNGDTSGGPPGASSPANPYTNLTGGLLGYFSANTVERRDIYVPY